jgi:hypothetical protein
MSLSVLPGNGYDDEFGTSDTVNTPGASALTACLSEVSYRAMLAALTSPGSLLVMTTESAAELATSARAPSGSATVQAVAVSAAKPAATPTATATASNADSRARRPRITALICAENLRIDENYRKRH